MLCNYLAFAAAFKGTPLYSPAPCYLYYLYANLREKKCNKPSCFGLITFYLLWWRGFILGALSLCLPGCLFFCQDEDLADVAAKQYYVEYGKDMLPDRLLNLLPSYLPESQLQGGRVGLEKWAHLVMNCHKKVCLIHVYNNFRRCLSFFCLP